MKNLFLIALSCWSVALQAQIPKIFQDPTVATENCYDFDAHPVTIGSQPNCHHAGKDFCGSTTNEVVASGSGRIVYADVGHNRGLGKTVIIAHKTSEGDRYSLYAHLSTISSLVTVGKYVNGGFTIGFQGKTGAANNIVHLHFEIKNHSGLGNNPDVSGDGSVGYVKPSLLPVTSRGYFDPNTFLNKKSYEDLSLASALPTVLNKSSVTVSANVNSPFGSSVNADLRLALYSTSGAYLGDIQVYSNKSLSPGNNPITFSKMALSSMAGNYRLQLDYKAIGASVWKPIPTTGTANPVNILLTP